MRQIHQVEKLCRICLSQGTRNVFDQSAISNLMSDRSDLTKIAEKLRFVTMLKVISQLKTIPTSL
jgi:hypothetical protein